MLIALFVVLYMVLVGVTLLVWKLALVFVVSGELEGAVVAVVVGLVDVVTLCIVETSSLFTSFATVSTGELITMLCGGLLPSTCMSLLLLVGDMVVRSDEGE